MSDVIMCCDKCRPYVPLVTNGLGGWCPQCLRTWEDICNDARARGVDTLTWKLDDDAKA